MPMFSFKEQKYYEMSRSHVQREIKALMKELHYVKKVLVETAVGIVSAIKKPPK